MEPERGLSHAYILSGPSAPAFERARTLCMEMLCTSQGDRPCRVCRDCVKLAHGTHPDFIIVQRQTDSSGRPRREIYVEQVREIVNTAYILPNEARKKVYVIKDADTMNVSAQNALLKLLEEPPDFMALLLLCENAGAMLETVRSRCAVVRVAGQDGHEPDPAALDGARRYLSTAAGGDALEVLRLCNELGEFTPAQASDFTEAALGLAADMLARRRDPEGLSEAALLRISHLLLRAGEYLRANVGVKHVFGLLSVLTFS